MPRTLITVDPRLLSLIGAKLYSGHPLPIVVRELIQNSRDACVRKGVAPKIELTVTVPYGNNIVVTCRDNGIGMTADQLVNDFLCLGNTSKTHDGSAVGGFGIAKAAIMRNPVWHVHSLDNYMDNTFLETGMDVETRSYLDGTEVTVQIDTDTYSGDVNNMLRMIYFSDIEVDLKLTYRGELYRDATAGLHYEEELLKLIEEPQWSAYRLPTSSLALSESLSPVVSTNYSFFRLNGLVQYAQPSYSTRDYNILFDLTPKYRPEENNYPFTMSREGLSGDIQTPIRDFIINADTNSQSVEMNAETAEINVVIQEGYMMHGKRNHARKGLEPISMEDLIQSLDGKDHTSQKIMLKNYMPETRDAEKDFKLLRLWQALILECAEFSETFGIGLILHDGTKAARITDADGYTYYLINPDEFYHITRKKVLALILHQVACHEVSHLYYRDHNEYFTNMEAQIFAETIGIVFANLDGLALLPG